MVLQLCLATLLLDHDKYKCNEYQLKQGKSYLPTIRFVGLDVVVSPLTVCSWGWLKHHVA